MPVPQTVKDNLRRGLEKHEEGLSGDGLEGATVREARAMAGGEMPSKAKIEKANRWFARNERFQDADPDSPAFVAWLLWGGAAGRDWFAKLASDMDNEKSVQGAKMHQQEKDEIMKGMVEMQKAQTAMMDKVMAMPVEKAYDGPKDETDKAIKAEAGDLSVGDLVRWSSSGGTAYGRITRKVTDGSVTARPEGPTMEGTEGNPAFEVRLYDQAAGEMSDTYVVHRAGSLSVVDKLPQKSVNLSSVTGTSADDAYVAFGAGLKGVDLKDGSFGFKGYLVRFSSADDPDLEGDFFDERTDFGLDEIKDHPVGIYFDHGFNNVVRKNRVGQGWMTKDKKGILLEGIIKERDEFMRLIGADLRKAIEEEKLGLSSAIPPGLMDREAVGKAMRIKNWPIGEASLTPMPAEARNVVVPMKSLRASIGAEGNMVGAKNSTDNKTSSKGAVVTGSEGAKATTENAKLELSESSQKDSAFGKTENPMSEEKNVTAQEVSDLMDSLKSLAEEVKALKSIREEDDPVPAKEVKSVGKTAPAIRTGGIRKDNIDSAAGAYYKTGDMGGIKNLGSMFEWDGKGRILYDMDRHAQSIGVSTKMLKEMSRKGASFKVSNNTDMNIGTAADGGNLVPTGHFATIISRAEEQMLANQLGVRSIPGVGTTVDVQTGNDAEVFVSTAEAANFDRDAPVFGKTQMTLTKYTKYYELSDELLADNVSNLMDHLADYASRAMAKTHNNLLVTEVAANGSTLNTFASATAIAAGELETGIYDTSLAYYLTSNNSVGWVSRPPTYSSVISITGNERQYLPTNQGQGPGLTPSVLGYRWYWSNQVDAIGASNKPILFGNFNFVGMRNPNQLEVFRDREGLSGQEFIYYYFRTVYKVLNSNAIGFFVHPSA